MGEFVSIMLKIMPNHNQTDQKFPIPELILSIGWEIDSIDLQLTPKG
ncbi:hypothetical protein L8106_03779 [Lyngbya sp. PCC 8106]|nr:hypothetical protein L8106_03779 [Lyngbya sp. PCC 8106]